MTPEYGAASQLEKINMLDYADCIVINKSDKPGAADALIEVRKQYKRNHGLWNAKDGDLPVLSTTASLFNDAGTQDLFIRLMNLVDHKTNAGFISTLRLPDTKGHWEKSIIPAARIRYLSEIHESIRDYNLLVDEQRSLPLYMLSALEEIKKPENPNPTQDPKPTGLDSGSPVSRKLIRNWPDKKKILPG
jgi:methylmalonyl-CoA mutase